MKKLQTKKDALLQAKVGKKVAIRSLRIDRRLRSREKINKRRDRTLVRINSSAEGEIERRVFKDGKNLYVDYRDSKHLFTGTGLSDHDVAVLQHKAIGREKAQWTRAHKVMEDSTVLQEEYRRAGTPFSQFKSSPADLERLEYIKQMHHVKERFENLSEEAKEARAVSIKADEGVFKLSSLLSSKAIRAYKFDMRIKMQKDLEEKRGRANKLRQEAEEKEMEADEMSKHVQRYGFTPEEDADLHNASHKKLLEDIIGGESIFNESARTYPKVDIYKVDLGKQVRELEKKLFAEAMADHGESIRPSQIGDKAQKKLKKDAKAKAETKIETKTEAKIEAKVKTETKVEADTGVAAEGGHDQPGEEEEEEEEEPPTFEQLVAMGNLFKTEDVLHARSHKRERIDEHERLRAKAEAKEREAASKALQQLMEDGADVGKMPKRVREVDAESSSSKKPKEDIAAILDLPPNTTKQAGPTDADLHARVIRVDPHMVPSLCQLWTLRKCPKGGLACPRRHYFCSQKEKSRQLRWCQQTTMSLEAPVVHSIAQREEVLVRTKKAIKRCEDKFRSHFTKVQHGDVAQVLELMQLLRAVTVEASEWITRWQRHIAERRMTSVRKKVGADNDPPKKKMLDGGWVVRLAVTGKTLLKGSTAFNSKVKRFSRDEQEPKKELIWLYVGTYDSRVEAELAYDAAAGREAIRMHTIPERMPPRRMRIRPCGRHYTIESQMKERDTPLPRCELCATEALRREPKFTPSWLFNGTDYLLKASRDADFLGESSALREWLGKGFPLEHNPLFLVQSLSGQRAPHPNNFDEKELQKYPGIQRGWDFGNPAESVETMANGVVVWKNNTTMGPLVRNPKRPRAVVAVDEDTQDKPPPSSAKIVLTVDRMRDSMGIFKLTETVKKILGQEELQDEAEEAAAARSQEQAEEFGKVGQMTNIPVTKVAYFQDNRGAVVAIQQHRTLTRPAAGERIFCDSEKGQWKGMRVRGRFSKTIAFQRQILKEGKARINARKKMYQQLEKALARGDEEALPALIRKGRKICQTNDRISDICNKAEAFLITQNGRRYATALWQRLFRGHMGRKKAMARAEALSFTSDVLTGYTQAVKKVTRSFLSDIRKRTTFKIARKLRHKQYATVQEMDTEHCVVTVYDCHHEDVLGLAGKGRRRGRARAKLAISQRRRKEEKQKLCKACKRWLARCRMSITRAKYEVAPGPCCCARKRPGERVRVRAYNPVTKAVYHYVLGEEELRLQLLWLVRNCHLPREQIIRVRADDTVMKASRLEPLPTDELLGYSNSATPTQTAAYRSWGSSLGEAYGTMRKRFEPLWEAKVAARRVAALERMRDGMVRRVDDCTLALEKEEEKRAAAAALYDAAREKYLRAHRNWLRALLNRTAMVKLANDAMAFSKNTLELYDNVEKASKQQVYDAFEDASSHIWLQRKRESIKEERRRMAARLILFDAMQLEESACLACTNAYKLAALHLDEANETLTLLEAKLVVFRDQRDQVFVTKKRALKMYLSRLTLRSRPTIPLRRMLVYDDPNWYLPRPRRRKDIQKWLPIVVPGWNACYKKSLVLNTMPFRWERKRRGLFFVTVLWSRQQREPTRAEDVVLLCYNPAQNRTERVLLLQREMKELLLWDKSPKWLRKRWPKLFRPVRRRGLFHQQQQQVYDAHMQVVNTLVSLMRLNIHDGRFECGKMRWWRARRRLVKRLNAAGGGRWWNDVQALKSSGRGWEVFREGRRINKRRVYIVVYENYGDLTFELFEPARNKWLHLYLKERVVAHAMQDEGELMANMWRLSARGGRYSKKVIRRVVDRLKFRVVKDPISDAKKAEIAENITKNTGMKTKFCARLECPEGRMPIVKFIDSIGRFQHVCKRCLSHIGGGQIGGKRQLEVLVFRRAEAQKWRVVHVREHCISRSVVRLRLRNNAQGDVLIRAAQFKSQIEDFRVRKQPPPPTARRSERQVGDGGEALLEAPRVGADAEAEAADVEDEAADDEEVDRHEFTPLPELRITRPRIREALFPRQLKLLRYGLDERYFTALCNLMALRYTTEPTLSEPAATTPKRGLSEEVPLDTRLVPEMPAPPVAPLQLQDVTAPEELQTSIVLSRRAPEEHCVPLWSGFVAVGENKRVFVRAMLPINDNRYDTMRLRVRAEALHEWESRSRTRELELMAKEDDWAARAAKLRRSVVHELDAVILRARREKRAQRSLGVFRRITRFIRNLTKRWLERIVDLADNLAPNLFFVVGKKHNGLSLPVELGYMFDRVMPTPMHAKPLHTLGRKMRIGGKLREVTVRSFKRARRLYMDVLPVGQTKPVAAIQLDAARLHGEDAKKEALLRLAAIEQLVLVKWKLNGSSRKKRKKKSRRLKYRYPMVMPRVLRKEARMLRLTAPVLGEGETLTSLQKEEQKLRTCWVSKVGLQLWHCHGMMHKSGRRCMLRLWRSENKVWFEGNLYARSQAPGQPRQKTLQMVMYVDEQSVPPLKTKEEERLESSLGAPVAGSKPKAVDVRLLRLGTQVEARFHGRDWYKGTVEVVHEDYTCRIKYEDGDLEDFVPLTNIRLSAEAERSLQATNHSRAQSRKRELAAAKRARLQSRARAKMLNDTRSDAEKQMHKQLDALIKGLHQKRDAALAKARARDVAEKKRISSAIIFADVTKKVQPLNLSAKNWQQGVRYFLGEPKGIAKHQHKGCAFFHQHKKIREPNQLASEMADVALYGDVVVMKQGGAETVQRAIFADKERLRRRQFAEALAQLQKGEAEAKEAEEKQLLAEKMASEKEKADAAEVLRLQAQRRREALEERKRRLQSSRFYRMRWRRDLRERIQLTRRMIPSYYPINEALPRHRVPVSGKHLVGGDDAATPNVVLSEVVHIIRPEAPEPVEAVVLRAYERHPLAPLSGDAEQSKASEHTEEQSKGDKLASQGLSLYTDIDGQTQRVVGRMGGLIRQLPQIYNLELSIHEARKLVESRIGFNPRTGAPNADDPRGKRRRRRWVRGDKPARKAGGSARPPVRLLPLSEVAMHFAFRHLQIMRGGLSMAELQTEWRDHFHSVDALEPQARLQPAGDADRQVVLNPHSKLSLSPGQPAHLRTLRYNGQTFRWKRGLAADALQFRTDRVVWRRPLIVNGRMLMVQARYEQGALRVSAFASNAQGKDLWFHLVIGRYRLLDINEGTPLVTARQIWECCQKLLRRNLVCVGTYPSLNLGLRGAIWIQQLGEAERRQRELSQQRVARRNWLEFALERLQVPCRRARMRRWWIQAERRRRAFEVRKFEETNKDILEEWVTMRGEDRESTRLRPYLTIGFKMLKKLRKNFDMFDKDGNGTIDAKEFQDMIFELNGEALEPRVVRKCIRQIDLSGNGSIEFNEFVWWFCQGKKRKHLKGLGLLMLNLQLNFKKFGRQIGRNIKNARTKHALLVAQKQRLKKIADAAKEVVRRREEKLKKLEKRRRKALKEAEEGVKRRRKEARKRVMELHKVAHMTPEEREAHRFNNLSSADQQAELQRKSMEADRARQAMEADRREEAQAAARLVLEEDERKTAEEENRKKAELLEAQRIAAERNRKHQEKMAAKKDEDARLAADAEHKREAAEKRAEEAAQAKKEKQREEQAEMDRAREEEMQNMDADSRAKAEKRLKDEKLMREAEEKMAAQRALQFKMQRRMEEQRRAQQRREREKIKAKKKEKKAAKDRARRRKLVARRARSKMNDKPSSR